MVFGFTRCLQKEIQIRLSVLGRFGGRVFFTVPLVYRLLRIVGIVTGVADESDFPPKTEEPFLAQVFEEELKEFERKTGSR